MGAAPVLLHPGWVAVGGGLVSGVVAGNPGVANSDVLARGGMARDWQGGRDVFRGIAGDRAARVS